MTVRCYKCGLVRFSGCDVLDMSECPLLGKRLGAVLIPASDCRDFDCEYLQIGWRKAERCILIPCPLRDAGKIEKFTLVCCDHGEEGICRCSAGRSLGTDPAIVCPACEKEA